MEIDDVWDTAPTIIPIAAKKADNNDKTAKKDIFDDVLDYYEESRNVETVKPVAPVKKEPIKQPVPAKPNNKKKNKQIKKAINKQKYDNSYDDDYDDTYDKYY